MRAMASQITSPVIVLPNRLFRRKSKKTSKLRVRGLCAGNSQVNVESPAQMGSNAENDSIWWRHHGKSVETELCQHLICWGEFFDRPFDIMNVWIIKFKG